MSKFSSQIASEAYHSGMNHLFGETADDMVRFLNRTIGGGTGAGAGAATLASNAFEGNALSQNLGQAMSIGSAIGAVIALMQARTEALKRAKIDEETQALKKALEANDPHKDVALLRASSPVFHVDQIKTPL